MAHTIAEKILAAKSDRDEVFPGEFITAKVDLVLASELSGVVAIEEFGKVKGASIFDPDKVVFVMDHFTPNKDIQSAEIVKECRAFAREHRIKFFDVGRAYGFLGTDTEWLGSFGAGVEMNMGYLPVVRLNFSRLTDFKTVGKDIHVGFFLGFNF